MSTDPFLDAESSVESSQPREMYKIVQSSAVTYFVASGTRDIVYNGDTYVAFPMARTEATVDSITNDGQLTIALPLSHGLAQRYLAQGSPPREVSITVYRQQPDGLVERFAGGVVTSMAIDKHLAKFLVQSKLARVIQRKLPVIKASRTCPHILYDRNCRADRGSFTLNVFVETYDGRKIVISSIGGNPNQWAQFGELVHVATGERMQIIDQLDRTVTLQAPIPDLRDGDALTVSAGCAHDIVTCHVKFTNQVNFGGFPQLPTTNPFEHGGLGVLEQT